MLPCPQVIEQTPASWEYVLSMTMRRLSVMCLSCLILYDTSIYL